MLLSSLSFCSQNVQKSESLTILQSPLLIVRFTAFPALSLSLRFSQRDSLANAISEFISSDTYNKLGQYDYQEEMRFIKQLLSWVQRYLKSGDEYLHEDLSEHSLGRLMERFRKPSVIRVALITLVELLGEADERNWRYVRDTISFITRKRLGHASHLDTDWSGICSAPPLLQILICRGAEDI